ncbi:MAG: type II toxin-antitoxin system prevent-host-death family antitoxin [Actinomycetota bacterium]|nr:type II toxin-antitoxin system prevent-host-death family antitoxin [Actinomycetota bacterium]
MENRVGVRELRQNLSVYLRRVRRGETLEVTERGQPVARLTPLPEHSDVRGRLIAEGRLIPRLTDSRELPAPLDDPALPPTIDVLDELREDRI